MKPRTSKRKLGLAFPLPAKFRLRHNIAHDMLSVVRRSSESEDKDFNRDYPSYTRPLIALVFACSAIDGHTNFVGQSLDKDWISFSKGKRKAQKGRPGIKDKIEQVYALLCKQVSFSSGVFQQVTELFEYRGNLMHPPFDDLTFVGNAPPADIFEMLGEDFDPKEILAIAKNFKKRLLTDSGIQDVKWSLSCDEIPAPHK